MSLSIHHRSCLHHWLENILIEVLIEPLKLFIFPDVAYSLRLLLDLLGNLKQLLLCFLEILSVGLDCGDIGHNTVICHNSIDVSICFYNISISGI